ncbi:type II toxin-antitoxin system prevent-host-death family antitoxin [Desulfobulbus sp. F5]|nr:type II toxin-antitoxin system prevent-host-death family antitoxin [Desulfobulbus sp. F5]
MELHPQLIQKAGRNEFVVLPIEEFEAMTELIETYEELRELRAAKEKSAGDKSIPLSQVISDLGL